MPSNKDSYVRYRAINRCLIDKNYATLIELIHYCEEATGIAPLSRRTIEQDLQDMREDTGLGFFAPIKYDRQHKGYHYEQKGYSIDEIPLKNEEIQALNNALGLLFEYKGTGIFGDVEEAVEKLVSKVKIGMMRQEENLGAFMELERGHINIGTDKLKECVKAIKEKWAIEVEYKKFNSNESKVHVVHPCYLKEYRNRWYLIGWHQKHQSFSIFAIDRINQIEIKPEVSYEPPPFDPAAYFKNVIGMSAPAQQPEEVLLLVNNSQLPFLFSQPIHSSLEMVEKGEQRSKVKLTVIVNYELKNFILGLLPDVVVEKPLELKNEIANILSTANKSYQ